MSTPSPERIDLFKALNYQSQLLAATVVLFEQAAADQLHLNVTHLHCANLLRLTGPMTAGQLAELTGLTTGAVTSMIDRLERAGYVRRESDPHDRRRVVVHANAAEMERAVGPIYDSLARASEAMVANYDDQALAMLVEHLTRNNALMLDEAVNLRRTHTGVPDTNAGVEINSDHVEVPLGSLQAGHLVFTTGSTRLTINGDAAQANLFSAQFGKLAPSVFVEDGLVKVFYRHALLNWSANTADVKLHSGVPWRIEVLSSGSTCIADLRSVMLQSLDVDGKASNIEALLPRPTAPITVRITGNASNVVIRRAMDTALQVRFGRDVSSLMVDGQDVGATGSKLYQTPDYERTPHHVDIDMAARLTTVTIETYV